MTVTKVEDIGLWTPPEDATKELPPWRKPSVNSEDKLKTDETENDIFKMLQVVALHLERLEEKVERLEGAMASKSLIKIKDDLIGKFFHSFLSNGVVCWQGKITNKTELGYLVQLYEWISGSESDIKLVSPDDVKKFSFYDSAEQMRDWYTHVGKYRQEKIDQIEKQNKFKLIEHNMNVELNRGGFLVVDSAGGLSGNWISGSKEEQLEVAKKLDLIEIKVLVDDPSAAPWDKEPKKREASALIRKPNETAGQIFDAIKKANCKELTKTEIIKIFNNNKSKNEINFAIKFLMENKQLSERIERGSGAPTTYYALSTESENNNENI